MSEWVNCRDELPEMYDSAWKNYLYSHNVLVYTDSQDYWFGHFELYSDGTLFFNPDGHNIWEVIGENYWCDLPAPPKIKPREINVGVFK